MFLGIAALHTYVSNGYKFEENPVLICVIAIYVRHYDYIYDRIINTIPKYKIYSKRNTGIVLTIQALVGT